jgi:hypothetical protein
MESLNNSQKEVPVSFRSNKTVIFEVNEDISYYVFRPFGNFIFFETSDDNYKNNKLDKLFK